MFRGKLTSIIALCITASSVLADSQEKLEAWLLSQLRVTPLSVFENLVIEWTNTTPPQLTAAELNDLRAQVTGFPDHPGRLDLEIETLRHRDGGTTVECHLYLQSAGNWRISETYTWEKENIRFVDTCLRSDRAWRLIPTQLRIIDPRSGFPENSNYNRLESEYTGTLHRLLSGGVGLLSDARIISASVQDRRWTARIGTDERQFELIGSWIDHGGTANFYTESRRIIKNPLEEYVGKGEVYSDWKWNDQLRRPLPSQIQLRHANQRVEQIITLKGIRPLPPAEFERISLTPEVGVADEIRGITRFSSVWDHRPNVGTISYPDVPGYTVTIADHTARSQRTTVIGWIMAGLVAAVLVLLRVRKHSLTKRGAV